MPSLSGTVHIRPIRLGFVVSNITTAVMREAARLAAGVWGGVYFPVLDAADPQFLNRVESLALDVLHPLDEEQATLDRTKAPGYGWRGRGEWGPFSSLDPSALTQGLLPIDRVGGAPLPQVMVWANDAVGDIYDVWLGPSGANEDRPEESPWIDDLPDQPYLSSALARTATSIEYRGESGGSCVVVTDGRADSLFRLWNLRAIGMDVHPWFTDDPDGSERAVDTWLTRQPRARPEADQAWNDATGPSIYLSLGDLELPEEQLLELTIAG